MTLVQSSPLAGAPPADQPAPGKVPNTAPPARVRLDFLDGIRGLAALMVACGHAQGIVGGFYNVAGSKLFRALELLFNGGFAVAVFIVLSGYCLMLPVARQGGGERLPFGTKDYLLRRAWRILPPYYAALLLFSAAAYHEYRAKRFGPDAHTLAHYGLTRSDFLSHLAMLHNVVPQQGGSIDGPMWSVATEWDIYFLLPLLLLPLLRRAGPAAMLAGALVAGMAPYLLPHGRIDLTWLRPEMLFLFACGGAAALVSFCPAERYARWRRASRAWMLAAGVLGAATLATWSNSFSFPLAFPVIDMLWGLFCAAALVTLAHTAAEGRATGFRAGVVKLLQSRPAAWLGKISYSLYLIHVPLAAIIVIQLQRRHLSAEHSALAMLAVGVPAIVCAAYLFYLLFERPTFAARARLHSLGSSRVREVALTSAA